MSGRTGLRIFISYNKSDLNWATFIARVVEEAGHTAVIQDWDSTPGQNFPVWISEQIDECDIVLPVYSADYFASSWCTSEWTAALNKRKMIPAKISKCTIPTILSRITYVNLIGLSEENCRKRLLAGLRGTGAAARTAEFPSDDRSAQADEVRRRWQRVARQTALLSLLVAPVVFVPDTPTDPGGSDPGDPGIGDAGAGSTDSYFW